jgi:hypothetical protein
VAGTYRVKGSEIWNIIPNSGIEESLDTGVFCRPEKGRLRETCKLTAERKQLTVPGRLEDGQAWPLEDLVDRRTDQQAGTS